MQLGDLIELQTRCDARAGRRLVSVMRSAMNIERFEMKSREVVYEELKVLIIFHVNGRFPSKRTPTLRLNRWDTSSREHRALVAKFSKAVRECLQCRFYVCMLASKPIDDPGSWVFDKLCATVDQYFECFGAKIKT